MGVSGPLLLMLLLLLSTLDFASPQAGQGAWDVRDGRLLEVSAGVAQLVEHELRRSRRRLAQGSMAPPNQMETLPVALPPSQ